jgi:hypothetical protein
MRKLVQLRNRFQGSADPYIPTRPQPSLSFLQTTEPLMANKREMDAWVGAIKGPRRRCSDLSSCTLPVIGKLNNT